MITAFSNFFALAEGIPTSDEVLSNIQIFLSSVKQILSPDSDDPFALSRDLMYDTVEVYISPLYLG